MVYKSSNANIKIGTVAFNPPYEIAYDKNHAVGFDIEIIQSICVVLKESCELKIMSFNELFTAIKNKNIDLAIGGITITNDRSLNFRFSLPYLVSYARFLSLNDSKFTEFPQKVGVIRNSVFVAYLMSKYNTNVKIKTYEETHSMIKALKDKQVEIIMADEPSALYWDGHDSGIFALYGSRVRVGMGIGIMAHIDNNSLVDRVNSALITIESNGTYMTIYNKYMPTFTDK